MQILNSFRRMSTLLGMPDIEMLELPRLNKSTVEPSWKSRQVDKQTMQDKSFVNINLQGFVTVLCCLYL